MGRRWRTNVLGGRIQLQTLYLLRLPAIVLSTLVNANFISKKKDCSAFIKKRWQPIRTTEAFSILLGRPSPTIGRFGPYMIPVRLPMLFTVTSDSRLETSPRKQCLLQYATNLQKDPPTERKKRPNADTDPSWHGTCECDMVY
jgi:hypothetical protein